MPTPRAGVASQTQRQIQTEMPIGAAARSARPPIALHFLGAVFRRQWKPPTVATVGDRSRTRHGGRGAGLGGVVAMAIRSAAPRDPPLFNADLSRHQISIAASKPPGLSACHALIRILHGTKLLPRYSGTTSSLLISPV